MATHTRIRHLIGLSEESSLLEGRIQELCEHQLGGTILISAPRGRGKTLLWQSALEAAKHRPSLPQVVSIDLESEPNTYEELSVIVQKPGFLPANVTAAAITLVKAFADAAAQSPIPWISKFIVKFIGVLPEIAERLTKSHLDEDKQRGDLGLGLLKEVVRMAGQRAPLVLIIENIESVSTMSIDQAIEQIVDLIRQNLPILLIITFDERRLSKESVSLLNLRVDVGDAILCVLPAASKDDIQEIYGPVSKPVLKELYQLAEGNISTFQDLWAECHKLKLIQQDRRGWVWNADGDTDQFGKLTNGANAALTGIMQQCISKVGDENPWLNARPCAASIRRAAVQNPKGNHSPSSLKIRAWDGH